MKTAESAYNTALGVIDATIGRAQQYSERMLGMAGSTLTDESLGVVTQPSNLRGTLRDYQLQGFRWIVRRAFAGESIILGDEMGLGELSAFTFPSLHFPFFLHTHTPTHNIQPSPSPHTTQARRCR
jgi:hypothetical protein